MKIVRQTTTHLLTRQKEKIIVILRQIYTLRESKSELAVEKTTSPDIVWLEREILIMMNITY